MPNAHMPHACLGHDAFVLVQCLAQPQLALLCSSYEQRQQVRMMYCVPWLAPQPILPHQALPHACCRHYTAP